MKPEKLGQSKQLQKAKYLVDANVFLEVELEQKKADVCERVLRKFHLGELEGLLVDFAIDTIVIIMENYGKKWGEIRTLLSSLLGYKGLRVHFSSLLDRIVATNHMKNYDLDFDDALALQAMKENRIENIISYDKDFDKIPYVKRIQPESLL
ncbi:MAG: type II toxin-antitoxin system VapC family toxin [Candidatus Bathyarchaeia archaeon]|nr:type II toxin-antitoxin system VapC family toxin [Candidatus Bathyarchaeia archaeon]